jgi:hypothetical protein
MENYSNTIHHDSDEPQDRGCVLIPVSSGSLTNLDQMVRTGCFVIIAEG